MNEQVRERETAIKDKEPAVFLHAIERRYTQGAGTLEILKGAELAVWSGQSVALIAPSGTGKSTLLHIAGLLEHPDAGEVYVDGTATSTLSDAERTRIRRSEIGFVYQFHHLLPEFSALENVMLPQMIRGLARREARKRADELLSYLGLKERLEHRPAQPSCNLDPRTAGHVFQALAQLVRASGLAAVIATHNMELAQRMDRRVTLQDGRVVEMA
jgi:lipoprotein-releasing system ATP-binding protein